MELKIDGDLQSVAEFMQRNIPASKLLSVAEDLPKIGRLLWGQYPQEPSFGLMLAEPSLSDLPPTASVSDLATVCAGDGFAAAGDGH